MAFAAVKALRRRQNDTSHLYVYSCRRNVDIRHRQRPLRRRPNDASRRHIVPCWHNDDISRRQRPYRRRQNDASCRYVVPCRRNDYTCRQQKPLRRRKNDAGLLTSTLWLISVAIMYMYPHVNIITFPVVVRAHSYINYQVVFAL